jgi:putative SOS response-associated peptidase YedK
MCGRFTLTADGTVIQQALGLDTTPEVSSRYNVAPTQPVAVVTGDNPKTLNFFNWGLIPFWAKDPSIGSRMINARSETAHEKPSFKAAMKYRRCLIPADGWFEWQAAADPKQKKTPMFIHKDEFEVFAFAGLWERWNSPDGSEILSCTILTTDATDDLKPLHHRMPVVLSPDDYDAWLLGDDPTTRQSLLKPYTDEPFSYYPVSTQVNKPINDTPENIVPMKSDDGSQQMRLL